MPLLFLLVSGAWSPLSPEALGLGPPRPHLLLPPRRHRRRLTPVGLHLPIGTWPTSCRCSCRRAGPHRRVAAAGWAPAANQEPCPRNLRFHRHLQHRGKPCHFGIVTVEQWTLGQANRFVSVQRSLSIQSSAATVERGATLPFWAPAGTIFAMNDCSGVYLSSGNSAKNVPGQQIEHGTWNPAEQSASFTQVIGFTFNRPASELSGPVPLLTYGPATLAVVPAGGNNARLKIESSGTSINGPPALGFPFPDRAQPLARTAQNHGDHRPQSQYDRGQLRARRCSGTTSRKGPAVVKVTPTSSDGSLPLISVAGLPVAPTVGSDTSLCRSLVHGH